MQQIVGFVGFHTEPVMRGTCSQHFIRPDGRIKHRIRVQHIDTYALFSHFQCGYAAQLGESGLGH